MGRTRIVGQALQNDAHPHTPTFLGGNCLEQSKCKNSTSLTLTTQSCDITTFKISTNLINTDGHANVQKNLMSHILQKRAAGSARRTQTPAARSAPSTMPRFVVQFRSTVMVRLHLLPHLSIYLARKSQRSGMACTLPRGFARFSSCLQPFCMLVRNISLPFCRG